MNIDYNKIIKEKAIIIWYFVGMRGNSIYRILAAHPEVYWNSTLQLASQEILQHPLDLPETVSGFNAPDEITTDAEKKGYFLNGINYLQFAYTTYHSTAGTIGWESTNEMIKAWITSKSYLDKKLFVICHPAKKYKILTKNAHLYYSSLLPLDNKPHIWVYGTTNRLKINKIYFKPSPNPLAYNLNLDALYSTDYSTFETEYYKLIAHFNLTSCLNRVRAFILLSLEREKYISKFY
jgi:hypothetical protein